MGCIGSAIFTRRCTREASSTTGSSPHIYVACSGEHDHHAETTCQAAVDRYAEVDAIKRSEVRDMTKRRAYDLVWELLRSVGGAEEWVPGGDGAGGGKWILRLRGKLRSIDVHDRRVNDLDRLYIPKADHPSPTEWGHYEQRLMDDAFWRLVGLFDADAQATPSA